VLAADLTAVTGNDRRGMGDAFRQQRARDPRRGHRWAAVGSRALHRADLAGVRRHPPLFYLDIATTVALWAVIRLILRRQAV
jgi:hypothetical protein